MPSQFTPSRRELLYNRLEKKDFVASISKDGEGLTVFEAKDHKDTVSTFTDLMETHGWYVAAVDTYRDQTRFDLMPVVEVSGDE